MDDEKKKKTISTVTTGGCILRQAMISETMSAFHFLQTSNSLFM